MNPTLSLTVGTVAVVGIGKVVKGDGFDVKTFVAGGLMMLFISAIANVDEHLATLFAGGIFLTALYMYAIPITKKLGFTK